LRWILVLLVVLIAVLIARSPSTHCETLKPDGSYDRTGCR
jgi:hypothetical protein